MDTYKSKQYLFVLLKVVVVIAALGFIYFRIKNQDTVLWADFKTQVLVSPLFTFQNMVSIIGLSVLNWFFEGLKWQVLARKIKIISFPESFKQVLVAQTTSIFTPFKIGEYGAKTLFFEKKHAKKAVFLNFLGNMAQMCATLVFGVFGLFFYLKWHIPQWLGFFVTGIVFALLLIFFGKRWISLNNLKIRDYSIQKISDFLSSIPKRDQAKVLIYSFVRYLFFSFQFCLLLSLITPVSWATTIPLVFVMYLLSSLLPVLQLFDFAVKGGVAVLVFSAIPAQIVVLVVFLMWLLNAVLPTIAGSLFVVSIDTKKLLKPLTK